MGGVAYWRLFLPHDEHEEDSVAVLGARCHYLQSMELLCNKNDRR